MFEFVGVKVSEWVSVKKVNETRDWICVREAVKV